MSDDSSMMGAFGRAANQAAQGAMLGHAIGRLNNEVDEAINLANDWRDYAKRLENEKLKLAIDVYSISDESKKTVEDYEKYIFQLKAASNSVSNIAKEEIAKSYEYSKKIHAHAIANEAYGKALKSRLYQMEKALRWSIAEKIGQRYILDSLEALITRVNLIGELPDDLLKNAERIGEKFLESEALTDNEEMQKMIDEAPIPERQLGTTF